MFLFWGDCTNPGNKKYVGNPPFREGPWPYGPKVNPIGLYITLYRALLRALYRALFGPCIPFVGCRVFPLWAALYSLCGLLL